MKDMYKMFDGSALVALGKYLLIKVIRAAYYGTQEFLYTSVSNGPLGGIPIPDVSRS